jgi:hypothetical protein
MVKRSSVAMVILILVQLSSCGGGSGTTQVPDTGVSGSGGSQAGTEGGVAGSGGQGGGQTEGGVGPIVDGGCPSDMLCTAPDGKFVCTDATSGAPPVCTGQSDCSFGTCTPYKDNKSYCTLSCGPAEIATCPSGALCNQILGGAYVCVQNVLSSSPPCTTQKDCAYGQCVPSIGGSFCIQPCKKPELTDQCPTGTACAPFAAKFYCALPSTGFPDTCTQQNDTCKYGTCLTYEDAGSSYCTQECTPKEVDACPNDTVCLALTAIGQLCSDKKTIAPPVCQSQTDCSFGTCIKFGDQSYCTEYCSNPVPYASGTVFGLSGALEGVNVCWRDNNTFCTTTNADGGFAIYDLPSSEKYFVLSMSKTGYQSNLQLAFPGTLTAGLMFTSEEMTKEATAMGVTPTSGTGSIVFIVYDGTPATLAGYTVAITPKVGSGPFYADTTGLLSKTATSSSAMGYGAFYNLPAGKYQLDFSHSSLNCTDLPDVIVESGYLTYVVTACL